MGRIRNPNRLLIDRVGCRLTFAVEDRRKEKCGFIEKIDLNAPPGKTSLQAKMDEACVVQTLLFVGVNTLLQTLCGTRLHAIVGGSNTYILFIYLPHELEQKDANSIEFGPEEKEASLLLKSIMDDVLENKICDLYDLYVERLEEGSGLPVVRLYEEISLLWPSGAMSSDAIRGCCKSTKRQEKTLLPPKGKMLAPETEDAIKG